MIKKYLKKQKKTFESILKNNSIKKIEKLYKINIELL